MGRFFFFSEDILKLWGWEAPWGGPRHGPPPSTGPQIASEPQKKKHSSRWNCFFFCSGAILELWGRGLPGPSPGPKEYEFPGPKEYEFLQNGLGAKKKNLLRGQKRFFFFCSGLSLLICLLTALPVFLALGLLPQAPKLPRSNKKNLPQSSKMASEQKKNFSGARKGFFFFARG